MTISMPSAEALDAIDVFEHRSHELGQCLVEAPQRRSARVTGEPSWNFAFGRRSDVIDRPSGADVPALRPARAAAGRPGPISTSLRTTDCWRLAASRRADCPTRRCRRRLARAIGVGRRCGRRPALPQPSGRRQQEQRNASAPTRRSAARSTAVPAVCRIVTSCSSAHRRPSRSQKPWGLALTVAFLMILNLHCTSP